jgi:hypothetical protein
MKSKAVLASVLALVAVSVHADPRGRAVPAIFCKSSHISIVINKSTCHVVANEGDPTCQASASVGSMSTLVDVSVTQGPFPQTNIASLMIKAKSKNPSVAFLGMDSDGSSSYKGQGHIELGDVNTTENMICVDPQPRPGHL